MSATAGTRPRPAAPLERPRAVASVAALTLANLHDRRRSLLTWGLPIGLMCALVVAIYPSIEDSIGKAVADYPPALKEAFGIGDLTSVEQYLQAEMLSLIVPLALGYLAVRSVAAALTGAAESGRLDVLLSAPVSRPLLVSSAFAAAVLELAGVLLVVAVLTALGAGVVDAGLPVAATVAGMANVWPLAVFFAGLATVATGWSLRTSVVTGSAAGVLVAMYVLDLIGRLDPDFEVLRQLSVFKYYGNAIEDGVDPLAFAGLTLAGIALAALGSRLFDRRDISG